MNVKMNLSQNSRMSDDPETNGFDLTAGKTWIYPENYPIRDYQFNIVQTALYNNTLVCLPTGLGKTFIAAVVMYNFWRWYPKGKIIFLAPTRPLVAQQMHACHDIMGIPSTETIELTGAINQKQRDLAWLQKRVIFATPQVFHNDLEKNIIPSELVKCVVIDEAHKALGKHSYCQCIQILQNRSQYFRVLALSATPGNKIDNVHEILKNLLISKLELRDDTSPDIIPYINERKVDIILIPLSEELAKYKDRYINIMDRHVRCLIQCNVIKGQTANISKGRIFYLMSEFKKKTDRSGNYGQIMKTLNILYTMYLAYELMIRHGLRAFYNFYQNHSDKFWMHNENHLKVLLDDIISYLGPFPMIELTPDGLFNGDVPNDIIFGHNKFQKLKELLLQHFQNAKENTKAIVFVEYRDIVNEVYVLLLQSRPLIKPQKFVGQAGQKQKQQLKAIENFRNNTVNVLISTCIGEEGLDVGEVDLIVCFDVSQQSPIRLVQRMGRTGRRRDGRIIVLVTDGKEHDTLKSTMKKRDSINNQILCTSNIHNSLYNNNPRMIPESFIPECHKIHITIQPKGPFIKTNKKNDKQPTKKIKDNKQSSRVNAESNQSSMSKFLKSTSNDDKQKPSEYLHPALTQFITNTQNVKASNIKLLSSDSEALDFLTLCAMKKSKKDLHTIKEIDVLYVPIYKPILRDFFDFVVPNENVLNCICTLEDIEEDKEKDVFVNNEFPQIEEFCCSRSNSASPNIVNNQEAISEYKFEDLLEESSNSNDDWFLDDSEAESVKLEASPKKKKSDTAVQENIEITDELEPGSFEDILDNSLNDSNNFEDNHSAKNEVMDDAEDGMFEDILNDSLVETNHSVDEADDIERGMFEDILDESSNSSCEVKIIGENKAEVNSNKNASINGTMVSVTQAINEINRVNSNKVDNEMDESIDVYFDNIDIDVNSEVTRQLNNDTKNNNLDTNLSPIVSSSIKDKSTKVIENLHIDDVEWNSDFDIFEETTSKSYLSTTSKSLKEIKETNYSEINSRSPKEIAKTDEAYSPWISVKSNLNNSLKSNSMNLAKKLSSLKKCSTPKSHKTVQFTDDLDDFEDKTMISFTRSDATKSNYFPVSRKKLDMSECSTSSNNKIGSFKQENRLSLQRPDISYDQNQFSTVKKLNAKDAEQVTIQKFSKQRKRTYKQKINVFLDNEAEVSANTTISDDESDGPDDLHDFVSNTQNISEVVDMQAHYLQTVNSPAGRHGNFVFKEVQTNVDKENIYSQVISQENDTYLYDSFCVKDVEDQYEHQQNPFGYSILERAEELLTKRKRKSSDENRVKKKRKKVYLLNNSSSSEDEAELLRKQIQDESMVLKKNIV